MRDTCDKCGSDIVMGECSCGKWYDKDQMPESMQIFERAIEIFNLSGRGIISTDHHSGSCCIYFKGDYKKAQMIVALIENMDELILENSDLGGYFK